MWMRACEWAQARALVRVCACMRIQLIEFYSLLGTIMIHAPFHFSYKVVKDARWNVKGRVLFS